MAQYTLETNNADNPVTVQATNYVTLSIGKGVGSVRYAYLSRIQAKSLAYLLLASAELASQETQ